MSFELHFLITKACIELYCMKNICTFDILLKTKVSIVNSATAANTNPSGKTNKMILINHPSKNTRFNSVPSEFGSKSHCASMHLSSLVLLSLEMYIFSVAMYELFRQHK